MDRVSTGGNAIASARPPVRLSVRSNLTFEPRDLWPWPFACVWVMTIALLGLKIKVMSQGQTSKVEDKVCATRPLTHTTKGEMRRYGGLWLALASHSLRNAVGETSILNRGLFSSYNLQVKRVIKEGWQLDGLLLFRHVDNVQDEDTTAYESRTYLTEKRYATR